MAGGGVAAKAGAVVQGRGGQFVGSGELTDLQREFVRQYVRNGGNGTAAARAAGYAQERADKTAWELLRLPHVMAALRQEQARVIMAEGVSVAIGTALDVAKNPAHKGSERVAAARLLLEAGRVIGNKAQDAGGLPSGMDKPLSEMTLSELEAFIAAGSAALKQRDAPKTIEGVTLDVTPEPSANSG